MKCDTSSPLLQFKKSLKSFWDQMPFRVSDLAPFTQIRDSCEWRHLGVQNLMVCVTPFRGQFGGVCTRVGSTYVWEWSPPGAKHAEGGIIWCLFVDTYSYFICTFILSAGSFWGSSLSTLLWLWPEQKLFLPCFQYKSKICATIFLENLNHNVCGWCISNHNLLRSFPCLMLLTRNMGTKMHTGCTFIPQQDYICCA